MIHYKINEIVFISFVLMKFTKIFIIVSLNILIVYMQLMIMMYYYYYYYLFLANKEK